MPSVRVSITAVSSPDRWARPKSELGVCCAQAPAAYHTVRQGLPRCGWPARCRCRCRCQCRSPAEGDLTRQLEAVADWLFTGYCRCTVNVENLFDEENAVALGRRTDKVFRAIKRRRRLDPLESAFRATRGRVGGSSRAFRRRRPVIRRLELAAAAGRPVVPERPRSVGCGLGLKLTWTTSRVA
jgi:hypothetical protein